MTTRRPFRIAPFMAIALLLIASLPSSAKPPLKKKSYSSTPGAGANDELKFDPSATAGGNWQAHLDWCIGNTGAPDCPELYIATYPECLTQGNRSCLLRKAIDSAKANDCANSFRLSLICQCHNAGAQMDLARAGQPAVCAYLKGK